MFDGMEPVELEHEGTLLRGYAALPDRAEPAPAVLVMHSALGVAHGFTDPESAVLHLDGVEYDALANDLSWTGTLVLLQHVFAS